MFMFYLCPLLDHVNSGLSRTWLLSISWLKVWFRILLFQLTTNKKQNVKEFGRHETQFMPNKPVNFHTPKALELSSSEIFSLGSVAVCFFHLDTWGIVTDSVTA